MIAQNLDTAPEAILPKYLQDLLKSCPRAGGGVHNWTFRVARQLHRYSVDANVIAALIEKYSAGCGREVSENEKWDAIYNSEALLNQQSSNPIGCKARPRWPERNDEQIAAIAKSGPTLAELEASSPIRWTDGEPHTEDVIDVLFPGNPLLCAGGKKELALTRSREAWRGFMKNQQFIVPSHMSSVYGTTKTGLKSMRCLANTGPRRFIVVESDQGDFDQHASVLVHLAKFAPLVMAVHSGNKSLHGWFFCAQQADEKVQQCFRYAVSLGADPATWTRCQYVRMPDGKRENGVRQRVVYFDPSKLQSQ